MHTSKDLQTAIDAAKIGGEIALNYFLKEFTIEKKHDNSLLTTADPLVENAIKKHILQNIPKAKFLAEESGGDSKGNDLWIIDPIDGTRVFAHGITQWSILIAHYQNGEITLGLDYIPTQNMLVVAEKGIGAYLNGEKIKVSETKTVAQSFGSFGSINRFKDKQPILKLLDAEVILRSYEHAYALSLLSAGRMDVNIDSYGTPWDYAPFICIIPEAGGKITDFKGNPWNLETKQLLSTNGYLHDEVLTIINSK